MNICKLKNVSGDTQDIIKWWNIDEEYLIPDITRRTQYANSPVVLTAVANSILVVNDGENDITDINSAIDYLKGVTSSNVNIDYNPAFKSKVLSNGLKLYRRKHGFSIVVPASSSKEETLTIPYTQAKINEVEFVNCNSGDSADFKVYDSVTGIYQQTLGASAETIDADLMLNQFGFGVKLPDGIYKDISSYDADVIGGMRIKITYTNSTAGAITIYGNIVYHEIK